MTTLNIQLVNTYSINSLGIADISKYNPTPINISMEITAPGWNKKNVTFTPSQVNVFTSSSFDIDCEDSPLPDGEYIIKYSVNPNSSLFIEKSFFRTSLIECKYKRSLLAIYDKCSCNGATEREMKNSLSDIRILIEGAIASAENCNIKEAYNKYKLADVLLSRMSDCGC